MSSGEAPERSRPDPTPRPAPTPAPVEPSPEALEAAELGFGREFAARVRHHAARIGNEIGHRWDCFGAAVYVCAGRKTPPDDRWGYIRSVALNYIAHGIAPGAEHAEAKVRAAARAKAERAAHAAAAETARRSEEPAEEPAPGPEEIAQWERDLSVDDVGRQFVARAQLRRWGKMPTAARG